MAGPLLESATGRCLDATCSGAGCSAVAAGAAVTVWTCRAGAANQAWTLTPGGQLVESMGGNCLEFAPCAGAGPGVCAGALLQVWTCNDWAGQSWSRTPSGELRNGLTGFCADVLCPLGNCSGVGDNTPTLQYNCTGALNQRWLSPSPPPASSPPLPPPTSPSPPVPPPPRPPPSPPPRVATLPPMPGAYNASSNASAPPPPRPPPAATPAAAPESLDTNTMVIWIIVGGLVVALAGFTCGACTPRAAAWLRSRRDGASIAPIADDVAAAGAERSGTSPPPVSPQRSVPPEFEADRLMYGCVPAWMLERPPPPPQLPAQPRHALARLSDRLARRVRLMRVVARAGSGARGASFGAADAPESGDARRRSSAAPGWGPPPLPERPRRVGARRGAEQQAEHDPEFAAEEFELPP